MYIFGIETKIQNLVGPESFGLYFSLFGLVFLHQFINDPGIQNYNTIYVSQNRDKFNDHFPRLLGLKIIILFVLVLTCLLSAYILGHTNDSFLYVTGLAITLFLSTSFVLFRSMLSGLGKFRIDTWLSSLDRFLLIIVIGGLILTGTKFSIGVFILIQVICYAFCVGISCWFLWKSGASMRPFFDIKYSRQFLFNCFPYALIILLTGIIMRADGVMIERLLPDGKFQAGIYAAGYRFLDASNMFGYIFGALLLPMFSHQISIQEDTQEVFSVAFRILFVLSLLIGGAFYFYADDIFALFYGKDYNVGIPTMRILILAVIPAALTNVFGPLILASRKIRHYNILYFATVLIYLILNFIFIPRYGNYASAVVAIITWSIILAGMAWICHANKLISINGGIIGKSIMALLAIGSIFLVFSSQIQLNWLLELVGIGLTTVIFLYLSKYIDIKEILHAVRSK